MESEHLSQNPTKNVTYALSILPLMPIVSAFNNHKVITVCSTQKCIQQQAELKAGSPSGVRSGGTALCLMSINYVL